MATASAALVTPVILAGGSGTRLWPLSRKSYPKQFVPLLDGETLFRVAASRLSGEGSGFVFGRPMVLTGADFRFIVAEQLGEAGVDPGAILIEPEGRNTAPAILAAALYLLARDPGAVMLVAPSDHVVPDGDAFKAAVARGLNAVRQGRLVTFGIRPTSPETGYGYLELAEKPDDKGTPVALSRFVEKPDARRAGEMLEAGNYLWNAGIFLFAAKDIVAAFEAHAPGLIPPVCTAVEQAQIDLGFLKLAPEPWADVENISIDYAIMEKADNLAVVPYASQWSDLGGWNAVWQEAGPDADGIVTAGAATAIDCHDSLLRADGDRLELVGIGLRNMAVIAMNDAVLVADMARAQDVGKAVEALRQKGAAQATRSPRDYRPWGWYETLALGARFQVKRITVKPGESLSLQSHEHRAEHWVIVEGSARVTLNDDVTVLSENQSVYVPEGAVHRIENIGEGPMVFIEVQTGAYLGEDDIVRYEDKYARD